MPFYGARSLLGSHSTMRKWLTLLTKSLGSLVTKRYVIVLVDVHPSHIDGSIFLHARRCGVRLVYIPAKLTSYLQPCDTHVFALLKQAVRKGWLEEKAKSEKGMICTESWLKLVCHAVDKILGQRRCWALRPALKWGECFEVQKKLLVSSLPA